MNSEFYKLKNEREGPGHSMIYDVYKTVHGWELKIGEVQLKPNGEADFTPTENPHIILSGTWSKDSTGVIRLNIPGLSPAQPPKLDINKVIDEILGRNVDPLKEIFRSSFDLIKDMMRSNSPLSETSRPSNLVDDLLNRKRFFRP